MNFQDQESTGADDAGQADDLNEALAETDPTFVAAPKRPVSRSTMGVFTVLAALAAATWFMYVRNGPQSAAAATPEAAAADKTISEFLASGGSDMPTLRQLPENTQRVAQLLASRGKTQVPLSQLQSNPFCQLKPSSRDDASDASSRQRRDEERIAILKAVERLQLQSVILGGKRKACMINNTMFQEGQQLEAFTIEQITPHAVVVRNGMYRFELKMQK